MVSNQSIALTTGCQNNNNSDTLTISGQIKSTYASYCVNNNFKPF